MPMIMSTVKKIDDLYLELLPSTRVINIDQVVRVNNITIFRAKSGRLYCSGLNNYCYTPGGYPWMPSLMRALLKMKVITKDQMDEHLKLCDRNKKRQKAKYAKESILREAKDAGITLTKAQIKKLQP